MTTQEQIQKLRNNITEAKGFIESFRGDIETWKMEIEEIKNREVKR